MTNQNQGNPGLESLLNSVQSVNIDELVPSMGRIIGSTPKYMKGPKAKYFIKPKTKTRPAKGQEIIVIPTEIVRGEVRALYYPLNDIKLKLEDLAQQLYDLRKYLSTTNLPHQAITEIYNELLKLTNYLKKYDSGKGFLTEAMKEKLKEISGYCKTTFGSVKDLLSLIDAATDQLGEDCNIFKKSITAQIATEYAEDKFGDVTVQIGEAYVLLDPTETESKFYKRDLIHYLSGEVRVGLIRVDKDDIVHCELASVPQQAAVKYSNYLKTNAQKTNDLEQASELFTKIDILRQYLEDRHEQSQDQFLPKINEDYIHIRDKYAILTARENGILRIGTQEEFGALEAYLDQGTIQAHSEKETLFGLLTCQLMGKEVVVFAFDFIRQNRYPTPDIIIAPFFGPGTNTRTAEEVLARKLAEKDASGIPRVFQLLPTALHQYDNTYLLTLSKLPSNLIPGMSFVKRDTSLGGYYLSRIHKPEFTLPSF